jgi:hypothetical protein
LSESPATLLPTPRLLRALALLLMTIGMAIMRHHVEGFSGSAILVVIAAAVLMGFSILGARRLPERCSFESPAVVVLLILSLAVCFWETPGMRMPFSLMMIASGVMVSVIAFDRRARMAPVIFGAMLLINGVLNLYFLANSDSPRIDVYVIQKLGVEKLLHGENPFAMTFPDIYGPNAHYYPPGIVWEHVVQMPGGPGIARDVQCGYFYWPMSLLLATPGYLFGDVRYSNLVSLIVAAALIAFSRPSRISFLAASVVLFCPAIFLMLVNAWLEPQLLMLFSLAMFFLVRGKGRFPVVSCLIIGLLVAEKQYMVLTVPVIQLMIDQRGLKPLTRAAVLVAIGAGVIIVPFFIWDPRAFLHSSHALYVNLIRTDAISILAWLKVRFDIQLHLFVTAGVGVAAAILVALFGRRNPATFAAGMAFVLTVSFLFSTQAFLNYYFFALGCLATAVVAGEAIERNAQPAM